MLLVLKLLFPSIIRRLPIEVEVSESLVVAPEHEIRWDDAGADERDEVDGQNIVVVLIGLVFNEEHNEDDAPDDDGDHEDEEL